MGRCFKPEARRHSADALAEMGGATLGFTASEKCGSPAPPGSSSIAAIIAVRSRSQWILTFGPVTSGPRIWRISSSARSAVTAAPMSGPLFEPARMGTDA